jgi:HK97 family phage prohead protease
VFRLSSEVLDRHADRVKADSVDKTEFDGNPVLLWNHDDSRPAIGTARVYREGNEWFMEPTFDLIGDLSKEVAAKVEAGTLRTCSFKFSIQESEPNAEGGFDYLRIKVMEVSITNVPANQEAVRVKSQQKQKSEGEQSPHEEMVGKALEQGDLEAIKAVVGEALKPVLEALAVLQAAPAQKSQTEEPPPPPEEPAEEKGKAEEPPPPPPEEPVSKSFIEAFRLRR